MTLTDAAGVFSEQGPLARELQDYAVRKQQQDMAASIAKAMEHDESLICEAGTGTGKTFAYLVPALLSGKKVIISTGTKHLQDQLFYKDLPVIVRALNLPVNTALLKGRANYLCKYRLVEYEKHNRAMPVQLQDNLHTIRQWSNQTSTGDLAELAELPEQSPIHPGITSTAENCLGQECEFYEECFVLKARRRANEADLVVVNHHLLMADLSLRDTGFGEVLPKAEFIIFDEAHQLPELASEFFGNTVSSRQILELINDTRAAYLTDANDVPGFTEIPDALQTGLQQFRLALGRNERRDAWLEVMQDKKTVAALAELYERLSALEHVLDQLAARSRALENCWKRSGNLLMLLKDFRERESDEYIQWLETRGQGFLLHQTPLDVSEIFQQRLAQHECHCIYTSATLAVGNDFSHFAGQLGLGETGSQTWASPFDYRTQAMLYMPDDFPDPADTAYTAAVMNAALPVIKASQGHAFILFTSHRALREAAELIMNRIDYPVLVQGDAPRTELLENFRTTKHAVLLGTSSFWEGVDVKGEALSCVIIDKLPFASPDDPVFRARAARMQEQGINPFMDYQLPQAIIALKQGVGRLIRDMNDYGVLMICDPRLRTRSYGRKFLNSLPQMNVTYKIKDVEDFYKIHTANM
jgi:ATP-dependent DNA helicase DinG